MRLMNKGPWIEHYVFPPFFSKRANFCVYFPLQQNQSILNGYCAGTVELQWLKQAGTIEISSSQRSFQLSRFSFYIRSRDSYPIYETSVVRVFLLLFSFSISTDRRSLKKEITA